MITGGFGFSFCLESGRTRKWYIGADGDKRWADNDELVYNNMRDLPNEDGFKFVGVDKKGQAHYCHVKIGDDGAYYMCSNTARYVDLVKWLPDCDAIKPRA